MTKKIGLLVGSLRKDSFNLKTAKTFAKLLPEGFEGVFINIGDLPFYNEDLDVEGKIPESWVRFRKEVGEMDGFFFFTPEYNRSVPAALKNALDVASRPYGQNMWDGKPALVVSVSMGPIAGFGANHHLRQILTFLNMPTLQQPEAYIGGVPGLLDDKGEYVENTQNFFKMIIEKYVEFFKRLTK